MLWLPARRPSLWPAPARRAHYSERVPDIAGGDERFRNDRGEADPEVAAALAAYAAGTGSEYAALLALADTRLLVPVVAVRADELADADHSDAASSHPDPAARRPAVSGAGGMPVAGEKASEMAMPMIVGRDGRRAVPAFTSAAAVRRWQASARPVPVPAIGVWQSAAQESAAVVIDIAGPVPLAVEGARLAALAAGGRPPAMHEDPDAWEQVAAAAAGIAPGIRVRLSEPRGDVDVTLELAPPAGAAVGVPDKIASQIADAVASRLADRLRLGIAVLVRPPA